MKKFFLMGLMGLSILTVQSEAALVTIQGTGTNYAYDGTSIYDNGNILGDNGLIAQADVLASLTASLGGNSFYGTLNTDYVDFKINLQSALQFGIASNITGGFFDVLSGGPGNPYLLNLVITGGTVLVTSDGTKLTLFANSPNATGTGSFNTIAPYDISLSSQALLGGLVPAATPVPTFTNGVASFDITAEQNPVPEPSTYALIGGALVGLGLLRRRKA